MADFTEAYNITILQNEGGYNPGKGEKETYRGIDRGANPNWKGWHIVDNYKRDYPGATVIKLNVLMSQNNPLQLNIQLFYKKNYWDVISLDKVNDQQLANNLFDCSVNQGSGMAAKFMQVACNYTIEAIKSSIKELAVDKNIGPATLEAFNSLPALRLNTEINAEREASYRADAGYSEWGKVWAKRLLTYT